MPRRLAAAILWQSLPNQAQSWLDPMTAGDKRVDAGRMEINDSVPHARIDIKLSFLRPFGPVLFTIAWLYGAWCFLRDVAERDAPPSLNPKDPTTDRR